MPANQFSYRAAIESMTGIGTQTKLRRDLGRRFSHRVVRVDGSKGLLETKHFEGRSPQEETAWGRAKANLRPTPTDLPRQSRTLGQAPNSKASICRRRSLFRSMARSADSVPTPLHSLARVVPQIQMA